MYKHNYIWLWRKPVFQCGILKNKKNKHANETKNETRRWENKKIEADKTKGCIHVWKRKFKKNNIQADQLN